MSKKSNAKRPYLFRLSLMSMFKRQRFVLLFVLLMGIILSLPVVLLTTVQNYLQAAEDAKLNSFGAFSDIYYEEALALEGPVDNLFDWETDFKNNVEGYSYNRSGLIVRLLTKEDDEIILGFLDNTARELARFRLIEGAYPDKSNEILVSEKLSADENWKLGKKISLSSEDFIISGIFQEFGRLWIRGQSQVDNERNFPNILLSQEGVRTLLESEPQLFSGVERTFLFVRSDADTLPTSFPKDQFFFNPNISMKAENISYGVPVKYRYVLAIAIFLVLFMLLRIFSYLRKPAYEVFRLQGLNRKRLYCLRAFELLLMLFLSFILSIVFIVIFSSLCHKLLIALGKFSYPFNLNAKVLLEWTKINALCIFLAGLIAYTTDLLFDKKKGQKKLKAKKLKSNKSSSRYSASKDVFRTLRQQMTWDIKQSPISFVSIILALFMFSSMYLENYNFAQNYQKQSPQSLMQFEGYLPMDYDYEFLIDGTRMGNTQRTDDKIVSIGEQVENPVAFFFDQYSFGADDDFLDSIRKIAGVAQVDPYRYLITAETVLDQKDPWTENFFFAEPIFFDHEIAKQFNFPSDKKTIKTNVHGFPENRLQELLEQYNVDEAERKAILTGEKCILLVPSYSYVESTSEDGGTVSSFIYTTEPEDNPIEYTAHKLGDSLDITSLVCHEKIWGLVSEETLQENMTSVHFQMPVGAIIRDAVRFDTSLIDSGMHSVIMANDAFDKLGMPIKYSRIRITLAKNAVGEEVDRTLQNLSLQNPVMPLKNLRLAMQDFRTYELFLNFFLTLLNIILFVVLLVIVLSIASSKLARNRREYVLLRLNGLSLKRFGIIWALYAFLAFVISTAMSLCFQLGQTVIQYIRLHLDAPKGSGESSVILIENFKNYWNIKPASGIIFTISLFTLLIIQNISSQRQLKSFGFKPGR